MKWYLMACIKKQFEITVLIFMGIFFPKWGKWGICGTKIITPKFSFKSDHQVYLKLYLMIGVKKLIKKYCFAF